MESIMITLPDKSKKKMSKGSTVKQVAEVVGKRLAQAAVISRVNGILTELDTPLSQDVDVEILTFDSEEGKSTFWHTSAHLLAHAVQELFPDVKRAIGPSIENGFYYDFFREIPFTPDDLVRIEERMKDLVLQKLKILKRVIPKQEALGLFKDNKFKVELVNEIEDKFVTIYSQGDFVDLCEGPHLPSFVPIKALKLLKVSAAYWRGDAKRASLQRIYGISFPDKLLLKNFLQQQEDAVKRDHRKLGKVLDLFSFHEFSPGSPFFHPKGTVIYNRLISFLRKEYQRKGYQEVISPIIFDKALWEMSGHWGHYKENMFVFKSDNHESSLKPMNCPGHCLLFGHSSRSYRDLPFRMAEFGVLHRNEVRGALGGLTRVRKFVTDDAHIFCTIDQLQEEIRSMLVFVQEIYTIFNFEYKIFLSTRPEDAMGDDNLWVKAEDSLRQALEVSDLKYELKPGDGAFYGPKIDVDIKDALGRNWQLATLQLDFNMPKNFKLKYVDADGHCLTPVLIHRAIFGSLERFIGVLVEHFAGNFPLWLNPNQVAIIPIADRHLEYCVGLIKKFRSFDFQVKIFSETDTTPKKIRNAQLEKYNYILVVGDREVDNKTVNVRTRNNKVHGEKKLADVLDQLSKERLTKSIQ